MGIRYYAYAFDADLTERALADPRSVIGETALAGAWGMPHGAAIETADLVGSASILMLTDGLGQIAYTSDHAAAMEHGTPTVEPRPFLKPAALAAEPRFLQRAARELLKP